MHVIDPCVTDRLLLHVVLPPLRTSARGARECIAAVARTLGCSDADLALIATELVTNAVRHAGAGDVHLRVSTNASYVFVEVTDGCPERGLPTFNGSRPHDEAVSGRGLLLLHSLECVCGVETTRTAATKTVTAIIDPALCA